MPEDETVLISPNHFRCHRKILKDPDECLQVIRQVSDCGQGKAAIAGYTDDETLVNSQLRPIIVFGDHTRAIKYVDTPIALGADGAKALQVNAEFAHTPYVCYFLRSVNIPSAGYSRHFKFLKEIQIPIPLKEGKPNLDEQKRIAYLLSKVEGLGNTTFVARIFIKLDARTRRE